MVSTRTVIEAICPRTRDNLNQVFISLKVFGKQNKVPTAHITLNILTLKLLRLAGNIDLTADNRLKVRYCSKLGKLSLGTLRIKAKLTLHTLNSRKCSLQLKELLVILHGIYLARSNLSLQRLNLCLQRGDIRLSIRVLSKQSHHLISQRGKRLEFIALLTILLLDIVPKLLDTEHITVISNGNTRHTVLQRLINKA